MWAIIKPQHYNRKLFIFQRSRDWNWTIIIFIFLIPLHYINILSIYTSFLKISFKENIITSILIIREYIQAVIHFLLFQSYACSCAPIFIAIIPQHLPLFRDTSNSKYPLCTHKPHMYFYWSSIRHMLGQKIYRPLQSNITPQTSYIVYTILYIILFCQSKP